MATPPLLGSGIELELLVSDRGTAGNFRVEKIKVVAKAAGLALPVTTVPNAELLQLCPLARHLALRVRAPGASAVFLPQSNTVLRFVAELFPASGLRGDDGAADNGGGGMAEARVDQWLEGTWSEYEVPAAALELCAKGGAGGGLGAAAAAAAREAMMKWLDAVDAALAGRTFLVGQRPTIADIALACAFSSALAEAGGGGGGILGGEVSKLPHLLRWYNTVTRQPMFEGAQLGDGSGSSGGSGRVVGKGVPAATKPKEAGGGKGGGKPAKGGGKGASAAAAPTPAAARPPALPATGNGHAALPVATFGTSASGDFSASALVQGVVPLRLPEPKYARRRVRVKELLAVGRAAVGTAVVVRGWLRTTREAERGQLLFLAVNDGSCQASVQCLATAAGTAGFSEALSCGGVGACVAVTGAVVESPAKGQEIEVKATEVEVLGKVYGARDGGVGGDVYPLSKKHHTLEHLRANAHLRPRSKVGGATMRVRHAMAFATHQFFNDRGFLYVHTPLVTGADCEGAGEQFAVTTLLGEDGGIDRKSLKPDGKVDFSKDFFGKRTCLTVSGQLNVETHCCALGDVYTFGPTFRAEHSITSRHLAEFWMIEPEIAFATLADDMDLAEDYLKYLVAAALGRCDEDLAFFEQFPGGEKGLRDRLRNVLENDFVRITYTRAVELLHEELAAGRAKFERRPEWGDDLGSEHERYITEQIYKRPVIVTNYPRGIKAFYMKLNTDGKTVAAMDILVPKIGEIIGGSQREEDLAILVARATEMGLNPASIDWYLDLRRYGTMRHAGFGLGFERLVLFVTGLENIKDVIPFPRAYGAACEY